MQMIKDQSLGIVHVVDSLELGGLERVVTDLAIAQKTSGHRVSVFSILDTQGFRPVLEAAGIPVAIGDKRRTLDYSVLAALRKASASADVVHAHNFVPNYYAAMATLLMRSAPALVGTCHDMGARLQNRRLRWLYRWSLTRTERVAMVGQQVHTHFVGAGIVQSSRARKVLNGVPVERFENSELRRVAARGSLAIPEDALVVGCVGRLVPLKNHQVLISMLPELLRWHSRLHLVLAGDGPLLGELRAQASALNVNERVLFLGAQTNIANVLPAFDVFALPSTTEGLSIALLEACAAGLAIVATAVGGNGEIVRDMETGRLVAVDDPVAIAAALTGLLDSPLLRTTLGNRARDWVTANASVDSLCKAYDSLYHEAISQHRSALR